MSTTASFNPVTMMTLSAIAYDPAWLIEHEVKKQLGLEVVWGPAENAIINPDSLAFIVYDSGADAYTVVIRGTDPTSWKSWTGEDFTLTPPQLFTQFVGDAPGDAIISQGTCTGLNDLIQLVDSNNVGMVAFLTGAKPSTLFVTGHSLGGTLTPPLLAYLAYQLSQAGVPVANLAPCSFAGLTPGNASFNSYFNGLFSSELQWRFYNTLDFAPLCWWSFQGVKDIYAPWKLEYGKPESDLLTPLFTEVAETGYAQPAGGYALTGTFDTGYLHKKAWVLQAVYQHHHTTYQGLVSQAFPG